MSQLRSDALVIGRSKRDLIRKDVEGKEKGPDYSRPFVSLAIRLLTRYRLSSAVVIRVASGLRYSRGLLARCGSIAANAASNTALRRVRLIRGAARRRIILRVLSLR